MQMDSYPRLQIVANCNILENCRPDRCCVVLLIFFFFSSVIMHQKWHSGVGFVGCFSGLAVATCGLIYLHQDLRYMAAETLT